MILIKLFFILIFSNNPLQDWCIWEPNFGGEGHYILFVDGDMEEISKVEAFLLTEIHDNIIEAEWDHELYQQSKTPI